jgi:pyrroloquinoline quinone biosynthesis protein A
MKGHTFPKKEHGLNPATVENRWHRICLVPLRLTSTGLASLQTRFMPTFYRRHPMQWTTPAFTDLRFGFEITMYIANR